jgi:pilus assembly protein Flp/PilA
MSTRTAIRDDPVHRLDGEIGWRMMKQIRAFLGEESGPTAVEYAVMLALILTMIISAVQAVGSSSGGMWGKNRDELQAHGF